jgi:DNA-binding transcriptional LysR family regulator
MCAAKTNSTSGELPHLGTFLKAAELQSFTAAAVELGVTQAAVSQRISTLERELRSSLFNRRAGRVSLTGAGERVYQYARQILDLHDAARTAVGALPTHPRGDLSIAVSSVPAECYLPALLSEFHGLYPEIHVKASVSDSRLVANEVASGGATIGLVGSKIETSTLEYLPIGTDALVLVVPAGHALSRKKSISLKALAHEPLIVREPGSGSRDLLEKSLQRAGSSLAAMNVTLEMGSNAVIKDAVRRGLGVSFVSQSALLREMETGELSAVPVRGLVLTRDLYAVYRRHKSLSQPASAFLRFLKAHPLHPEPR